MPAIVTGAGGPKFLIEEGVTGFVAHSEWDFISAVNRVMTNPALHHAMRAEARRYACRQSWEAAFEKVLEAYDSCLHAHRGTMTEAAPLLSSRLHERDRS